MLCLSSLAGADTGNQICLHIFTPGWGIKKIKVQLSFSIRSLDKIYQMTNYLYKGSLMSKDCTFGYYGVQEGDCLITVSAKIPEAQINSRILSLSTDSSLRNYASLTNARECTKLNDLRLLKLEMKPSKFRSTVKNMQNKRKSELIEQHSVSIMPEAPSKISSEPLPVFWHSNAPKPRPITRTDSGFSVEEGDIDKSQKLF